MCDCGLGKTRGTLMAIQALKRRWPKMQALVFAPRYPAVMTWPNEIKKWTPDLSYVVLHGSSKDHRCSLTNHKDIIIVPYSSLAWFYKASMKGKIKIKKYMVVLDEASFLKSHKTKRSEMMKDMEPTWSPYKVMLSGTPAPQCLSDLWNQYYLLDKGKRLEPYRTNFLNRYFYTSGPPHFHSWVKPEAKARIYEAIDDITLRMDKHDYLELPETIVTPWTVKLSPTLRKQYNFLEQEFCLEFPDEEYVLASTTAALNNKLRQFCQGGLYLREGWRQIHTQKAEILQYIMETSVGMPVLAAIQFKFEYEIICKVLKYKPPIIYGGTSEAKGQEYLRQYSERKLPLLLCHPASIGHGLNIQTGGNILVWMALPWILEHYLQLNERLDRQGQLESFVNFHHIFVENSKDQVVSSYLQRKIKTQNGLFKAITKK